MIRSGQAADSVELRSDFASFGPKKSYFEQIFAMMQKKWEFMA
jgi:hypothetical protein